MRKFVQKLRAKPEEERKHIVNIATFISAILLVTLWSFTLGRSFKDPDLKVQVTQDLEPFKGLKANVIDGYNVVSDAPAAVKEDNVNVVR